MKRYSSKKNHPSGQIGTLGAFVPQKEAKRLTNTSDNKLGAFPTATFEFVPSPPGTQDWHPIGSFSGCVSTQGKGSIWLAMACFQGGTTKEKLWPPLCCLCFRAVVPSQRWWPKEERECVCCEEAQHAMFLAFLCERCQV